MTTHHTVSPKGFAAVLCGAIAIGSAPIFMRYADVTPTAAAFWRVLLSLPILAAWLTIDIRRGISGEPLFSPRAGRAMIIVGLWFSVELFFWHWSVAKTTVANATLLANMATVFTALAGFLFFKERFSRHFMLGLLLALGGAVMLIGQNAELNPHYLEGDLIGLACAVTYAGYIVSAARLRRRMPTSAVMFSSALVTAITLGALAFIEGGTVVPPTPASWLPLLGLALVTHILGQSLILFGLAHVPAALGAASLLVQPIIAAILAWILFGEALGPWHVAGALCIFAGIVLARRSLRARPIGQHSK